MVKRYGGTFAGPASAFVKSLAENRDRSWVTSKKKKGLHNNLVAKIKKS